MYAEIRAWDVTETYDRKGAGKSMWVNDADFAITLSRLPAKHLGGPRWHLKIRADIEEQRGAEFGKYIQRDLHLELTPEDIEKIVTFALSKRLLTIEAVVKRARK